MNPLFRGVAAALALCAAAPAPAQDLDDSKDNVAGPYVPTPWVIVWWNFPVPVSRRNAVPHATRILRVVDLGTATVVGESYELLRDRPDGGEFSDGEVRGGLSAMSLN